MRHKILMLAVSTSFCLSASGQEGQLGRLFTTPAERAKLDLAREQGSMPVASFGQPVQDHIPDQSTLDGYVIRKSGKKTTWINQIAKDETDSVNSVQVSQKPNHAPAIFIQTESGRRVKVGVGDTVDMHTGNVRKVYEPPSDIAATAAAPVKKL